MRFEGGLRQIEADQTKLETAGKLRSANSRLETREWCRREVTLSCTIGKKSADTFSICQFASSFSPRHNALFLSFDHSVGGCYLRCRGDCRCVCSFQQLHSPRRYELSQRLKQRVERGGKEARHRQEKNKKNLNETIDRRLQYHQSEIDVRKMLCKPMPYRKAICRNRRQWKAKKTK